MTKVQRLSQYVLPLVPHADDGGNLGLCARWRKRIDLRELRVARRPLINPDNEEVRPFAEKVVDPRVHLMPFRIVVLRMVCTRRKDIRGAEHQVRAEVVGQRNLDVLQRQPGRVEIFEHDVRIEQRNARATECIGAACTEHPLLAHA